MELKYRIENEEYLDESPRDWDNLGTMVCAHDRYHLGDEQMDRGEGSWLQNMIYSLGLEKDTEIFDEFMQGLQYNNLIEIEIAWDLLNSKILLLPLYLYDHSGLSMSTMNTWPFDCPWDAGQVGFIYVSIQDAKDEWGWERLTSKRREMIFNTLRQEVETYDQYLRGDVWGYVIEDDSGYVIDSCWGFYGYDYCKKEALEMLDYYVEQHKELNEFERLI